MARTWSTVIIIIHAGHVPCSVACNHTYRNCDAIIAKTRDLQCDLLQQIYLFHVLEKSGTSFFSLKLDRLPNQFEI